MQNGSDCITNTAQPQQMSMVCETGNKNMQYNILATAPNTILGWTNSRTAMKGVIFVNKNEVNDGKQMFICSQEYRKDSLTKNR